MNKSITIIFILVLTTSCKDNKDTWLQKYQNTKCNWVKNEAKFKADSIQNIEKLSIDLISIKIEIDKIKKPIQSEITRLNHRINEINIKYLNESRKISETHEQIYGHISTPKFEKKLKQNDNNNNRETLTLENKITALQSKLKDNETYQELISKQNKIIEKITEITNVIKEKYNAAFDGLQKELDNQNYEYKYILQKLDETERQKFSKAKDSIKQNPCKQV